MTPPSCGSEPELRLVPDIPCLLYSQLLLDSVGGGLPLPASLVTQVCSVSFIPTRKTGGPKRNLVRRPSSVRRGTTHTHWHAGTLARTHPPIRTRIHAHTQPHKGIPIIRRRHLLASSLASERRCGMHSARRDRVSRGNIGKRRSLLGCAATVGQNPINMRRATGLQLR